MKKIVFVAESRWNGSKELSISLPAIVREFCLDGNLAISQIETKIDSFHCSFMEHHPIVFGKIYSFISYCKSHCITFVDIKVM